MRYKSLEGFPNYHIYPSGKVYSVTSGRWLTGTTGGQHRYLAIDMRYEGSRKRMYIHRLVALLFVDSYSPNKEVNHINGDKRDNRASNLEWVSRRQNIQHAVDVLGHHKNEYNGACKFSNKLITEVRYRYNQGNISQAELSRIYGISTMQIHRIVKNKLRRM